MPGPASAKPQPEIAAIPWPSLHARQRNKNPDTRCSNSQFKHLANTSHSTGNYQFRGLAEVAPAPPQLSPPTHSQCLQARLPPEAPGRSSDLTESGITIPSDSENYEANNELSESPSSSPPSSSPLILYSPPTVWGLLRGAAINLFLPFVNGLMLGFGELFAHEIAFRLGWSGTKIFPASRSANPHRGGPGVEVHDTKDPVRRRRMSGEEMDMYTSLE